MDGVRHLFLTTAGLRLTASRSSQLDVGKDPDKPGSPRLLEV